MNNLVWNVIYHNRDHHCIDTFNISNTILFAQISGATQKGAKPRKILLKSCGVRSCTIFGQNMSGK